MLRSLMLMLLIVGCNTNTIRGTNRRLPGASAANTSQPKVYVDSTQRHATRSAKGGATLVVETNQAANVTCTNCPLPLSFVAGSGEATHKAEFEHTIVNKTYLCAVNLEVDYKAEDVPTKNIKYGLYFCPDRTDGSIHSRTRSCGDLSLATPGCPQ